MENFTKDDAQRMGAFEETGIDAKDALNAAAFPLEKKEQSKEDSAVATNGDGE